MDKEELLSSLSSDEEKRVEVSLRFYCVLTPSKGLPFLILNEKKKKICNSIFFCGTFLTFFILELKNALEISPVRVKRSPDFPQNIFSLFFLSVVKVYFSAKP